MDFKLKSWHRMVYNGTPVYFHKHLPDWFVPNACGDNIIKELNYKREERVHPDIIRFLSRLPNPGHSEYKGRDHVLELNKISELWFHITDQCNLACSHCLFSSSPLKKATLKKEKIFQLAGEAYSLGCRVFALTGGEPFVHPDIEDIIKQLVAFENAHTVILTNGMNLPEFFNHGAHDHDKLHLQISMDGLGKNHDRVRGKGAFQKLTHNLEWLNSKNIPFTLSMSVNNENVTDMPAFVDFAADIGAGNVHFMWLFKKGRGTVDMLVPNETIYCSLTRAVCRSEALNIPIDNIEALKTQIFAPPGTIHDGSTSAWESLAVGADEMLYPSAALIGAPELATDLSEGIEKAWKESAVLKKIRSQTVHHLFSPFRFFTGGGDIDHSYVHRKTFMGDDPYEALYEKLTLWLIHREADLQPEIDLPQVRLRMGEILESCGAHENVALIHSNCLLATAGETSINTIKSFYSDAVGDKKQDILNPVSYPEALIDHIPKEFRFRGYGCGSPVLDADIREGEHVVDLGCGNGVECFIASRKTGPSGQVTGIDMLDPMLEVANKGLVGVSAHLGYNNIHLKKGYLESLPLNDNTVDVLISNCVMNLSTHKRRAYKEIFRTLSPGGRLVISDVVCETEPGPGIRNSETLRGECIAGALTQRNLLSLMEETGFIGVRLIKRFPYRVVNGHPFFSLTYSAIKPRLPRTNEGIDVIYRGPLSQIVSPSGITLIAGEKQTIPEYDASLIEAQLFFTDKDGNVTNSDAENFCSCYTPPEENNGTGKIHPQKTDKIALFPKKATGCMVCGLPIIYLPEEKEYSCAYCGKSFSVNSICESGHFVCDACHSEDGFEVIKNICMHTNETDMIILLDKIRHHPVIPDHGPEHHMIVPAVILATYRNLGGVIPTSFIEAGMKRGKGVAGGFCAFMGICGAAVGVGIAFSLIVEATPLTAKRRSLVQKATHSVLSDISLLEAARCCQRDAFIALKNAASLSKDCLPVSLKADAVISCYQKQVNKSCIGKKCPLKEEKGFGKVFPLKGEKAAINMV